MEQQEKTEGTPPLSEGGEEEPKVFINENEWIRTQTELAELKGYKKAMEEVGLRNQSHEDLSEPEPPKPPPKPEFRYHSDEELQRALEEQNWNTYHKMMRKNQQTEIQEKLWELETTKIAPLQQTGMAAISDISGTLAKSEMPHLDIPEVRKAYELRLKQFQASGQMVTRALHKGVYDWAVGENIGKVEEKVQQGFLRQQEELVNTPPTSQGRKISGGADQIPPITEVFEISTLKKLQEKHGTHLSYEAAADRELERHGGWENYYKAYKASREGK